MADLRDALAAAIARFAADGGPSSVMPIDEQEADGLLADPAFRSALTEAVAEALAWYYDGEDDGTRYRRQAAAAIVARMVGDER